MEAIKEILLEVNTFLLALKINVWYVLLFVAAGYIQKQYCDFWKVSEAWKTLILGSIFSLVYALLLRDIGSKGTWVEFCASYIFATSVYELLLKDVSNWIVARVRKLFQKKLEAE